MLTFIGGLVVIVFSTIVNGWILQTLWAWFIVSTFNVQALSLPQALGVSLVVSFFLKGLKTEDTTKDMSTQGKIGFGLLMTIVYAILFLGMGWIIRLFM